MRTRWKVLSLADDQRETLDKLPLGKDPKRGWCYRHTSVKLSWSQPMAPWTWAAAYSYAVCAATNVHGAMDCDQESSCLGLYPKAACPEFHIVVG